MSVARILEYGRPGGGIGRTGAPPGAPLERSAAMMEGKDAMHHDFSIEFHIPRITMAIEPTPRLYGTHRRSPRLRDVLVPHILEYVCPRARIDRARRGARAPWEAMMMKDGG